MGSKVQEEGSSALTGLIPKGDLCGATSRTSSRGSGLDQSAKRTYKTG